MGRRVLSFKGPLGWLVTAAVLMVVWGCGGHAPRTVPPVSKPEQAPAPAPLPAPAPKTPAPPSSKPYQVMGKWYYPLASADGYREAGIASWYGKDFHGRKTSNGEIYNMYGESAAHKTLPLDTWVRVHNLDNNRAMDLRINDRGPFVKERIIDLSYGAAQKLGIADKGTGPVEVIALGTRPTDAAGKTTYQPVDFQHGNFTVQVGAFTQRDNAERLVSRLKATYPNAHITVFDNGPQVFYRVRVGQAGDLEQARQLEARVMKDGFPDAFMVAE